MCCYRGNATNWPSHSPGISQYVSRSQSTAITNISPSSWGSLHLWYLRYSVLVYCNVSPGPACTRSTNEDSSPLLSALSTSHPDTKIIPYPLSLSDEQATLTLIDDVLNAWGRLDVWVTSSGLLGPPSIDATTPADLQKCFEANSLAPFFALKYAPPAMGKLTSKGHYPRAAPKDEKYGSIVVVSSVASTYGGKLYPLTPPCIVKQGQPLRRRTKQGRLLRVRRPS